MIPNDLHERLDLTSTWFAIRELVLGLDDPRLRRDILDDTLPDDITMRPFAPDGHADILWRDVPLGRLHWTACVTGGLNAHRP